jgi:hypothetical protein
MTPRGVSNSLVRDSPVLTTDDAVETAVRRLLDGSFQRCRSPKPADRGIFGGAALFPGYLPELQYAAFVAVRRRTRDKRAVYRRDPVGEHINVEHVEVASDCCDAQVARDVPPPPRAHPGRRRRAA